MKRSTLGRAALLAAGLLLLGVPACSGGGDEQADAEATPADTMTRRQRDSAISEMPIPGAGAVGTALDAADDARARAEQHDTIH